MLQDRGRDKKEGAPAVLKKTVRAAKFVVEAGGSLIGFRRFTEERPTPLRSLATALKSGGINREWPRRQLSYPMKRQRGESGLAVWRATSSGQITSPALPQGDQ
jgi:hypothetical protein